MSHPPLKIFFLLALSGALLALSAPGFGLWPLAWVGMAPVFLWIHRDPKPSLTQAAVGGSFFGVAFHAVWLCWGWAMHPLDWLGFSTPESLGLTLLSWGTVSLYGGIIYGCLFSLYASLFRRLPVWLACLTFPLLWIGVMPILYSLPIAICWVDLATTQSNLAWVRWVAPSIGGAGITAILVLHNLGVAYLAEYFLDRSARKQGVQAPRPRRRFWTLAGVLPLLLWGVGLLLPVPSPKLPLPIAVLQGNLPIDVVKSTEKTRYWAPRVYDRLLRAQSWVPGTLVVMPEEGIIPGWVSVENPASNPDMARLIRLAQEKKIALMTGLAAVRAQGPQYYNALAMVDPSGRVQFYKKRHLVPFGEYIPYQKTRWYQGLEPLARQLGLEGGASFDPGPEDPPPLTLLKPGTQHPLSIGGLICFEVLFAEFSRDYRQHGVQLLVNVSNLGWFYGNPWLSQLMKEQFVAIARLRAMETRLPIVISANTGISTVIDGAGTVLTASRQDRVSVLSCNPADSPPCPVLKSPPDKGLWNFAGGP